VKPRHWLAGLAAFSVVTGSASESVSELSRKVDALRRLTPAALPEAREAHPVPGCRDAESTAEPDIERVDRAIRDASICFGVAPGLIRAVIGAESAGNANVVSPAGAVGLMQRMPGTAAELGVVCPFETRQNILGGTRYLRQLRDRLGSWRRALSAYNAGPTRVLAQCIPQETRRSVDQVIRLWERTAD
jgi:soluble lytic murein transglycosylase-like protein